jgi:hypothetical protein
MRLSDALKQSVDGHHPNTGFTHFWQRQFRQRAATHEEGRKAQSALQNDDQRGNLTNLKQRLLQQIEHQDVPQNEVAEILNALHHSYLKRFAQPAIEPLALIDALIALPERNDFLLRDLAVRLKPWRTELPTFETPPTLGPDAIETGVAPAVEENAIVYESTLNTATLNQAVGDERDAAVVVAPRTVVPHRYDERRFGSQQALLELLRRQGESGKSAMALIEIILA